MPLESFKVSTFNLYNLVLPDVTYYGRNKYSSEVYDKKKTWIGRQLERMNADIVGFQELFHDQALQEIVQTVESYENANLVVGFPASYEPNNLRPLVALISRFPVIRHQVYEDFPAESLLEIDDKSIPLTQFSRPILSAQLQIDEGIECTVFVVHLKSKRPILPEGADRNDPVEQAKGAARSLILRATEATALRMILMETLQNRQHPVIIMGDVNDSDLSVTTQIVTGQPPWKKLPFEKKKKIWDVLLYSVKDLQARQSYGDFYYTHIYNGYYQALDHIFVSEEWVSQNPSNMGRVEYVSVLNDHLVDETLTDEGVEKWQSDHAQIVATIQMRK
ncbi:MAG: endonuclease/exonuclease/phosphatase family protein [Cyanobacteria bacterium J06592_8]